MANILYLNLQPDSPSARGARMAIDSLKFNFCRNQHTFDYEEMPLELIADEEISKYDKVILDHPTGQDAKRLRDLSLSNPEIYFVMLLPSYDRSFVEENNSLDDKVQNEPGRNNVVTTTFANFIYDLDSPLKILKLDTDSVRKSGS